MSSFKDFFWQQQFSTLISIANDDLFALENHKLIKRINSNINPFCIHPVVIVADPFLFVYKDELFLFYEEQVDLRGRGVVKMIKTKDLKLWTKPIVVLEEEYHLSYPYVFEINGQIYMMPESGKNGTVQLYTPNEDLTKWTINKTILKGGNYVDSSIIYHCDTCFLFTTDYTNETNILKLFWSDSIDSEWIEHKNSPIAVGGNIGRCGGSIFKYQDLIFRPSQLTQKRYGEGLDLYQILKLSKNEYKEEIYKTIIPNRNKKYFKGGHHINFCHFKNQHIIATDIVEMKLNFIEVANRIVTKFKS